MRIERLLPLRRVDHEPSLEDGLVIARRIATKAVVVARRGALRLPVASDDGTLVIVPDFREVHERFTFEDGPGGPEALVRRLCPDAAVELAPIEKTNLGRLEAAVKRAERVVFLSFEARRFPGQAAALKLLARTAPKKTAAVLIRSSWDLTLCPKAMTVVDAAGYRLVSIEAALSLIFGGRA